MVEPMRRAVKAMLMSLLLVLILWVANVSIASGSSFHTTRGAARNHRNMVHDIHDNMNGDYLLSSTPGSSTNKTQRLFPTHYKDYPDIPTESFDVYSPLISQLYSQVFWKGLPPVSLPADIVAKYDGKVMAVVGFELDQVTHDPQTGEEFSIPMNALYNHHFESTMIGGHTARFELTSPDDPRVMEYAASQQQVTMGHGIPPHQPYFLVVGDDVSATGQPTRQDFGAANGGESRKSFHGYAPGFAQLIESPRELQITPMQIDTWHRTAMDLRNTTNFVAGPLPRNSLAPPGATYSGLLECPVTTRIQKNLPPQKTVPLASGQCSHNRLINNSDDCYKAVLDMVKESDPTSRVHQASGIDANRPVGCSARALNVPMDTTQERIIEAFYNDMNPETTTENNYSAVECGGSSTTTLYSATATSLVKVSTTIDLAIDLVTITLVGPANVWFAVGFGATAMKDKPWTLVVSGEEGRDTTSVTEHKLADHSAGIVIAEATVQVVSSSLDRDNNLRTVTLTRSTKGPYFNFDTQNVTEIPFINAIGSSLLFGYHQNKEPSSLLLLPVAKPSSTTNSGICICQTDPPPFGKAKGGTLDYIPVEGQAGEMGVAGKVPLANRCEPFPRMELLEQKNPTCDIRTYVGGQTACHHMWSLLDADQEIPWVDQPLQYRLKFRFWVQPYDPAYHTNVHRTTWGIGSPVEYDIPKCDEGIPGCSKQIDSATGRERWVHTIRGTFQAGNAGRLVAAHFHCHAPTCLSTALYLCENVDSIADDQGCDEQSGRLLCQDDAIWSTGKSGERFNEPGFISQPPCLWGSPDVGLEPPVNVRGRTLFAIKTADATHGHHGEMAWLQMYYA